MREGWKCPSCGNAHGPHVDTCPGGGTEGVEHPKGGDVLQGPVSPKDWCVLAPRRPISIPPDPYVWRGQPNCVDPLVRQWSANFTGVN